MTAEAAPYENGGRADVEHMSANGGADYYVLSNLRILIIFCHVYSILMNISYQ